MDLCNSIGNPAQMLGTALKYSFVLFLIFAAFSRLVVPDTRLPGISKREAVRLHGRSMFSTQRALSVFNNTGRLFIRIEKCLGIGVLAMGILFLLVRQVCWGA